MRRLRPAPPLLAWLLAGCTGFDPLGPGDRPSGDDDSTPSDDDSTPSDGCGPPVHAAEGPADSACASLEPYAQFAPTTEVLWQWADPEVRPESYQVLSIPVVIDLDDDGGDGSYGPGDVPDVVFISMAEQAWAAKGTLRAVRGDDGTALWTDTTGTELPSGSAPAAGELLASSPGPEIVVIDVSHRVVCLSAAGALLWATDTGESAASGALSIHDLDRDGEPEVLYGRVILGADGTLHGVGAYGTGAGHSDFPNSYAVDLDGDGALEVVVGDAAYRKDGSALFHNGLPDGNTAVGDFDLDGDPEVVVVGTGTIRLQDHQGGVVWGPDPTLGESGNGAPPTVADFDGDGAPEIGIADRFYYQVYDGDGTLLWSHATAEESSGITGSTVFDFNGDGTAEVVYADEETFFIFEGPTGATLYEEPRHSSRTNIEYPVVVDVDGNGEADILLPSNVVFETEGWDGLTALAGTNESGWWGTRRVWNQHAYFVDNVGDDGTIPQFQQDPWEVHNSFRQARPSAGWNGYPVPDLVPLADPACLEACPGTVGLRFRVTNRGAAAVPAGLPVSLVDPATSAVLAVHYVPEELEAGWTSSTQEAEFPATSMPPGGLEIRVDRFSSGDDLHPECDEANNTVTVTAVCP